MNPLRKVVGGEETGVSVGYDFRRTAHAVVTLRYRDVEIECEVYRAGDLFSVHTVCPKCGNAQWIDGRNKKINYDEARGLFVETFTCSWELDERALCGLRLAYEGRIAREA